MITLQSEIRVRGITGSRITEFLLNCSDEQYQCWWPGTHVSFHTIKRLPNDVGNLVFMDEYIGQRRVAAQGIVRQVVPGKRLVWQFIKLVRLPVWLTLELEDLDEDVRLRHTITAGFNGIGSLLDLFFGLYFSRRFAVAMDDHVRTEFPKLRDMLNAQN